MRAGAKTTEKGCSVILNGLLRFGAFELDVVNRELRKSGVLVKLPPQPLQVLQTLAANPPEWFSRRQRSPQWPLDFDAHSADHRRDDIEAALAPERVTRRARR